MSGIDDIVIRPMDDAPANKPAKAASDVKQVQIRFKPSPSAAHLPAAPETAFSVPVNLARLGLSELLNHILELRPSRPFEFLITNRFLRTSLDRYLTVNGLSGEAELLLEYIEALPPPEKDQSTPHPDWIADVDARVGAGAALLPLPAAATATKPAKGEKPETLVAPQAATFTATACFDGVVRVWAHPSDPVAAAAGAAPACVLTGLGAGHLAPVKAVRVLRPTIADPALAAKAAAAAVADGSLAAGAASALVVSASQDRTLRLWEFSPASTPVTTGAEGLAAAAVRPRAPAPLACRAICDFHTGTVECVETLFTSAAAAGAGLSLAARSAAPRFVSGGFEGSIGVWTLSNDYLIDAADVEAHATLVKKAMGRQNAPRKLTPGLALVSGSAGAAAAAGGPQGKRARGTTAADDEEEEEEEDDSKNGSLAGSPLLAVPHYRPASALVGGHKSAVTALCWPHAQHLYSGSLDCTVKHWDLAQAAPVHTWSGGHAVLGVDFSPALNLLATAEQDGAVRLWDPRAATGAGAIGGLTTAPKGTLKATDSWCVRARWAPAALDMPHVLTSVGYDGSVKFWDIRSGKPLHSVPTTSERLFAVDWVPLGDDFVQDRVEAAAAAAAGAPATATVKAYALAGGTGRVLDRVAWTLPVHE